MLSERRLLPLLGARALEIAPGALPADFAAQVERARAASRTRNLALQGLAATACDRLGSAGVRTLVLKGPPLAERLHGDIGAREVNDIDLLIRAEDAPAARAALGALGYRSSVPEDPERMPDLHWLLRDPAGRLPRIDLHWRIHWYESRFAAEMLGRASPGGGGLLEPSAADELAALLLFYARDGLSGLRGPADIAVALERASAADGPLLSLHVERHPGLRRSFTAAALALEDVVGIPAASLIGPGEPEARVTLAVALADWRGTGERDQLRANIDLIDGLLAPRGEGWSSWRRQVFPPRAEIADTYGIGPDDRGRIAIERVLHVARRLARFALGAGRALRGGERSRVAP